MKKKTKAEKRKAEKREALLKYVRKVWTCKVRQSKKKPNLTFDQRMQILTGEFPVTSRRHIQGTGISQGGRCNGK